jgi:hypothetical protein
MSRSYDMTVEVSGHNPNKEPQIKTAAEAEWPFADWCDNGEGKIQASAQDYLAGGESEEQFTERVSVAVWRANGSFCEVVVNATYMEELPYEIHTLNEDDYARLMHANTGEKKNEN